MEKNAGLKKDVLINTVRMTILFGKTILEGENQVTITLFLFLTTIITITIVANLVLKDKLETEIETIEKKITISIIIATITEDNQHLKNVFNTKIELLKK